MVGAWQKRRRSSPREGGEQASWERARGESEREGRGEGEEEEEDKSFVVWLAPLLEPALLSLEGERERKREREKDLEVKAMGEREREREKGVDPPLLLLLDFTILTPPSPPRKRLFYKRQRN